MPTTATLMEAIRSAIAAVGVLAAFASLLLTVRDFRLLRAEGVNGPTGVVYADKIVFKVIILLSQIVYVVVGLAAMMAPAPVPVSVAALLTEESANATLSVQTYLAIAVQGSIVVTAALLTASAWQLISRQRLAASLRAKSKRPESEAQAQRDRMEATGRDTNLRLRRSAIGDSERAIVDKAQADEIQATGDDSNRILRESVVPSEESQ
jgi:hypothetical protein